MLSYKKKCVKELSRNKVYIKDLIIFVSNKAKNQYIVGLRNDFLMQLGTKRIGTTV